MESMYGLTKDFVVVVDEGEWVMAASQQGRIWDGNRHDLHTDLYAFNAVDGANRRLVVKNGGWPSWADDNTVFFHRQSEDGWWSVYKIFFSNDGTTNGNYKNLASLYTRALVAIFGVLMLGVDKLLHQSCLPKAKLNCTFSPIRFFGFPDFSNNYI